MGGWDDGGNKRGTSEGTILGTGSPGDEIIVPVHEGPSCLGLEGPAEGAMSKLRAKKSREGRTLVEGPENRQTSVCCQDQQSV